MKHILVILGARPSVVKLSPVVRALRKRADVEVSVCATGQHTDLFDPIARELAFDVDYQLALMEPGQTPGALLGRAVSALTALLDTVRPQMVATVGDTTSGLAAALAAYNCRIPLAHVEAGLRTWNRSDPFPEEMNRRLIDEIADLCFAPTRNAVSNLLGVHPDVALTGNPVVDSVLSVKPDLAPPLDCEFVLVTAHRRENWGQPLRNICRAVRDLALSRRETVFVWPVHPNPTVRDVVMDELGALDNIAIREPMGYAEYLSHVAFASVVLTDSGGTQEEAATLGTPCVVLRKTTERPEGVEAGYAVLAGTAPMRIIESARDMEGKALKPSSMYGDGRAGERIADILATGKTDIPAFKGDQA